MNKKVAVVGGGAAGMMAAICAARAGADVELYERNGRVGKKILSTGNGKCNFSNVNMDKSAYYGSAAAFYEDLFSAFSVNETLDLFGQLGMLAKNKNGYLYPLSEQAATVLDILRFGLEKNSVSLHTDSYIEEIHTSNVDKRLGIRVGGNNILLYDAVILACGGMAAPNTGSDGNGYTLAKALGHQISEVVPALVQLRCREQFFKSIAGVRTQAGLTLYIDGEKTAYERGELQLTDYGISGIPVFQFSRLASKALIHKRKVTVDIDFLPDYGEAEYREFWKNRWKRQSEQALEQFLTGISNKKINQLIVRLSGLRAIDKAGDIRDSERRTIERLYRKLSVNVYETNGFDNAQVSAGGIPADELTNKLESKLVPGLYFAGEIIDIDGICGGYNLQWAWTSGAIAGVYAAGGSISQIKLESQINRSL